MIATVRCSRAFCRRLAAEPGLAGRVLDIGCGGELPLALAELSDRLCGLRRKGAMLLMAYRLQ